MFTDRRELAKTARWMYVSREMRIRPAVMVVTAVATARAEVLVATSNDLGALFVDQGAPDKVTKLYSETGKGAVAYVFSDSRTLWVLRKDTAEFLSLAPERCRIASHRGAPRARASAPAGGVGGAYRDRHKAALARTRSDRD